MFLLRRNRKQYLQLREDARSLVHARLGYFNTFYGHAYKKVFIKNHKSRWGSCSKAGNLNFNYKILFLPQHIADYIIVHELCHLKEFNHKEGFWRLVAKTIPNHRTVRAQLRQLEKGK